MKAYYLETINSIARPFIEKEEKEITKTFEDENGNKHTETNIESVSKQILHITNIVVIHPLIIDDATCISAVNSTLYINNEIYNHHLIKTETDECISDIYFGDLSRASIENMEEASIKKYHMDIFDIDCIFKNSYVSEEMGQRIMYSNRMLRSFDNTYNKLISPNYELYRNYGDSIYDKLIFKCSSYIGRAYTKNTNDIINNELTNIFREELQTHFFDTTINGSIKEVYIDSNYKHRIIMDDEFFKSVAKIL